jgi:hypothetical protein
MSGSIQIHGTGGGRRAQPRGSRDCNPRAYRRHRGVFASLTRIDIVAQGPIYYQTDHRPRAEIEAAPELSVLFALVRVCNAKRYKPAERPVVIYAADDVPAFLEEAVAAAGGLLASTGDLTGRAPAPTSATVGELADRAFRGLAERVQRRLGADDATAALRALEAEILASTPTQDADETRYWTCVLELSALTGELLRAAYPGTWVESEHPDLVFAFSRGPDNLALLTNRAQRFIDDGDAGESMFLLVASAEELRIGGDADRKLMPSLRSRAEATEMKIVFQPLFDHPAELVDIPVIAYGHDTATAFSLTRASGGEDVAALHAEALRNLASQEAAVESTDVDGSTVLIVSGGYYAAEKLLDVAFMRTLHDRLGELIAAVVPRRGLLVAAGFVDARSFAVLHEIAVHESSGSRRISNVVLLVSDGAVVGVARASDAPPPKKSGWLRRLFGRN